YEIFHDVLASAILDWQTQYTQARETDETKRQADEQRRRADEAAASARRFRRLTFALALVSILALATAAYAFTQQREAARNRRNAEQQYAHAERQRGLAADAERRAANERRKTEAEAARAESEKQAANEAQAAAERRQRENRELIAANEQRKREADAAQAQAEKARSAALAAKAALEQQKTLSTEQQQIEQMLLNAQTTQRTGNSETAAARYEEALARLERLNAGFARPNYRALANTHYLTGEAYSGITLTALEGHFFNVGKTDEASVKQIAQRQEAARREALKHFNAAVELYGKHAELTGEHFELAAAYSTLAKQYEQVSTLAVDRALASNQAQLENVKRAIGFYEQALWLYERPSLSDPTPKPREVIAMLGKLANLYTIIDKRKAITHYERLLAALRDIRNDSGRIVVLQSLARLHRDAEINQPRKALEYLKEADQLYAPNENSAFMRVPLLEGIAELHLRLDEKQQALDSYLTIYGIYEGGAKSGWSAPPGIRLKIADLYYWRGEKEKALGFYDAALGNFRPNAIDFALLDPVARQKAKREEGKVHQNMGQLYLEKGNKMKAATAFWLAVAAYQAGGDAAAADGLRGTRAKLCATLSEVEKLLAGCQSAAEVRPETPKPEK
ncbi:MAG TPA: hypothetical protein VER08_10995, partial [Pyrinomonadaceae bacterium]|nr:hypothetical protein [Pyrinomonadaceae bacterium]